MRLRRALALVSFLGCAFATLVAVPSASTSAGQAPALPALSPLHATHGADPKIVDADGRQVLLRGVNLSALGDYYLPNPAYPAPVPLQASDFADMAAEGFNVVRLLVHWSALEPERDVIDETYLDEVRAAVAAAEQAGVYVVIDMHQDAWGKHIASPPGTVCPPGTSPATGWDGAPQWATRFDPGPADVNTCRGQSREDSEAVRQAWDNFYADTDGIMSELVELWGLLGATFAHEAAVAGYDLLNEPNLGSDGANAVLRLGDYFARAIDAIRRGERAVGGFSHMAIFETTVVGTTVPYDFTSDENIVFSGHNYGDSITPLPMDVVFNYFDFQASQYGAPLWIGEYGWFSDPAQNFTNVMRYAAIEDELVIGSAWWQWIQACGDPHSIGSAGGTPSPVLIHYKANGCPGDVDLGPVPEWQVALSRPYPRAAPGSLTELDSDAVAATARIAGTGTGSFDLWVPDRGQGEPEIGGHNIAAVRVVTVTGGYRVLGVACDQYEISVGEGSGISGACELEPPGSAATDGVSPRFTG